MSHHQQQLTHYLQLSEKELTKLKDSSTQQDSFLDHLLKKFDEHIAQGGKILLITLTKKSSEEVTNFLVSK
jgi:excinuclease UvrABC helicase subunit UvrB